MPTPKKVSKVELAAKLNNDLEKSVLEESELLRAVPDEELTISDYKMMLEDANDYNAHLQNEITGLHNTIDQKITEQKELMSALDSVQKQASHFIRNFITHHNEKVDLIFNTISNLKKLTDEPDFLKEAKEEV